MVIKVHDNDNVVTAFENIKKGTAVTVFDKKKNAQIVVPVDDIPYGHKICVFPIEKGRDILKYGEIIGRATRNIAAGEHVHVHNLESTRGRGDWGKGQ